MLVSQTGNQLSIERRNDKRARPERQKLDRNHQKPANLQAVVAQTGESDTEIRKCFLVKVQGDTARVASRSPQVEYCGVRLAIERILEYVCLQQKSKNGCVSRRGLEYLSK